MREFMYDINSVFIAGVLLVSMVLAIEAGCTFPFELPYIPKREDMDKAGQCAQQVMRDYYPAAVWCDKSTFVHGGWRACVKGK